MNSEQLRLFISGAFGSEAEAKKIRRMLTPSLRKALDNVRGIVELLPDDSLVRQKVWREMLPAVEAALGPYNDEFAAILEQELPIDGLRAARETGEQMRSLGVPMLGGGAVAPEFVMADSTKFLLNTAVADTRIVDLFTPKGNKPSPFTTSNRRMIDSLVTGGIIKGESTANIAKAIGSELPSKMRGQSEAIARTAIQDYNRQVKEAVWDANADALEGLAYEWVSALDSRTCTVCAPEDGKESPKRTGFINRGVTPVHPRCRCQVVLIDPDDPGRVRFGQDAYEDKPTGKGVYKTKKEVKGKELYRKNREVKTVNGESPRYADYLYSSKGVTQEMFFGGGNVGKLRAERFNRYVKNGKSPQDALVDVLKGDKPKPKTARKLNIGNPDREKFEETLFLAPKAKVKATGSADFVASTSGLDSSLANGRQVLETVAGKDLPKIQSAVDKYQKAFKAYKANPSDPKARAALEKALDDGAPAMDSFIKRLEETPKGFKPPKVEVEKKGLTAKVSKQVDADIERHLRLFNGRNVGDKSLNKVVVDGTKSFQESSYDPKAKTLMVGAKEGYIPEVLHHEMAHALEVADPKTAKLAQSFRRTRAQHGGQSREVQLSDEEFDIGIRYVDEWINGYVGMDYKGMAELFGDVNPSDETEVISVAAEYLTKSPKAALELLARDPDHFALILSLTRTK